MDAALEALESRRTTLRIERDDFSVQDDRASQGTPPLPQRMYELRKLRRLFVPESRPETHARLPSRPARPVRFGAPSGFDERNGAYAVIFGLVKQVRIDERRLGRRQRGQHWA